MELDEPPCDLQHNLDELFLLRRLVALLTRCGERQLAFGIIAKSYYVRLANIVT